MPIIGNRREMKSIGRSAFTAWRFGKFHLPESATLFGVMDPSQSPQPCACSILRARDSVPIHTSNALGSVGISLDFKPNG